MIANEPIKVLLVEDDEDDYILTRSLFDEMTGRRFKLEWVKSFDRGLETMVRGQQDICLVDYRLGAQNGIELLRLALEQGCVAPIILLTGQGEHEIDMEAMKAGAADYLVKGRLDAGLLERSIRYAIERQRAAATAAAEQARLAAFGADVGLALTRRDSLAATLHRCATAMAHYLNADLACLWILDPEANSLSLQASAGSIQDAEAAGYKMARGLLQTELISERKPVLLNHVLGSPYVPDEDWANREKVSAYAGYPLVLEDRLVGLMSIYARSPLPEATLQEMASVANGIALCIERKRSEEALGVSEVKYRSVVENIKEVIFQMNETGGWTFLNPAWKEITGFELKDTIGTTFAEYIHPEDRERHFELFQELIQRKKSFFRDETRYLAKDGTYRWMEVYAQPTLGSALGTSGTLSDITERKRAEAEIQKLAAFVRFNPDPVMELAADGTLNYLNPAAREMARSLKLSDPEAILPRNAAAIAEECLRLGNSKLCQEISIDGRTLSWSFFPIVASQVVHCYGGDMTERSNLEAQLRHGGGEMRGQRGGDIKRGAVGMIDDQPARVEMHLAADRASQEGLGSAIFTVADDGMADRRHMHAQLVGAARQRLQLDPGGAVAGAVDNAVAGAGSEAFTALVHHHLLAAAARLLGERQFDQAVVDVGHAGDQRPIDLARRAAGKALGKVGGAAGGAGNQQDAGGILVEPVDQARARAVSGKGIKQPIDMLLGAGAALRREARRLVEYDGGAVLRQHHRLGQGDLVFGKCLARGRARAFGCGAARRDAQHLAGDEAVFGCSSLAIDPDLPGASPAADRGEADLRQVALEPAVKPHPVVVRADGELADLVVVRTLREAHIVVRISIRPANSPATPARTETAA